MGLFEQRNLDFAKLLIQDKVARPQMGFVLFPENTNDSALTLSVSSTQVILQLTGPTSSTLTINYVGKTLQDICDAINASAIPAKAKALSRSQRLASGDLLSTGGAKNVPAGFGVRDRTVDNGAIVRVGWWTVRHEHLSQTGILPPYQYLPSLPWYPRIEVGTFSQLHNGRIYHFGIPEYENQTWSMRYGKPFRDVVQATAVPLGNNAFQLPRGPVFWNGENIQMLVDERVLVSSLIEDIDIHNAILYLKKDATVNGTLEVAYSYLEKTYEYKEININGHFTQNPTVLDKYVVLYLLPLDGAQTTPLKRCVYHEIADTVEEAVDKIQREHEQMPVAVLGAYSIQQVFSADRLTIVDTRSLGGGLVSRRGPCSPKEDVGTILSFPEPGNTDIEDGYPDARCHWDIGSWDGESYPGAAAVVLDLPDYLKEHLPVQDIQKKARKFLAAGVYPVTEITKRELPAVTGFCAPIDLTYNLGLTESRDGVTGVGWMPTTYSIPFDSVLEDWTDQDFDPSVVVKHQDAGDVLEIDTTGVYQTYLKSTPVAGIYYEDRTILPDGTPTAWVGHTMFDTRSVTGGMLLKSTLEFAPRLTKYQVRDIQVHAPYRLDHTGELLTEVASDLFQMFDSITGQFAGTALQQSVVTDVTRGVSAPTSYSYGPPSAMALCARMASSNLSGHYTGHALSTLTGVLGYLNPVGPFFQANVGGSLGVAMRDEVDILEPLATMADVFGLAYRTYGADSTYSGIQDWYGRTVSALLASNPTYLTPHWQITNLGNQHVELPLTLSERDREITPTIEDHLKFSVAERILRPLRFLPDRDSAVDLGLIAQSLTGARADLLDSLPSAVNGAPYVNQDLLAANHWYAAHDRYGEFAGTVAKDLCGVYDSITSIIDRDPNAAGITGLRHNDLHDTMTCIEGLLDPAITGVLTTAVRGGVLDRYLPRLLYSCEWYLANVTGFYDGAPNLAAIDRISGVQQVLDIVLPIYVRGMVTTEGEIFETAIVDQQPAAMPARLPSEIFEVLALSCKRDPVRWVPVTQAVLRTTVGKYSFDGVYPQDPTFRSTQGHGEHYLGPILAGFYRDLEGTLPAPTPSDFVRV